MSVATTPSALPSARWMSVPALTSVNVPSPLLWIQQARRRLEDARDAVEALAQLVVAAEHVARQRELDEAAEEQIEPAVVVVVEPDRARRPAGRGDARLLGDVGERAVAVVVVQRAAAVRGDEDVGVAVVVVVGDGAAHAELRAAGDAGLVGDVGERAVAVVLVERVLERRLRLVEVAGAAVDHEDVDPAVVVVVEERDARPHRLRQVAVRRHRVVVDPGDAARARGDLLEERRRREQPRPGTATGPRRPTARQPKQTEELATGRDDRGTPQACRCRRGARCRRHTSRWQTRSIEGNPGPVRVMLARSAGGSSCAAIRVLASIHASRQAAVPPVRVRPSSGCRSRRLPALSLLRGSAPPPRHRFGALQSPRAGAGRRAAGARHLRRLPRLSAARHPAARAPGATSSSG